MKIRILISCLFVILSPWIAAPGWSGGLYGEFAHASNARTTDRNLGRNFVHVGWDFANGNIVSGGAYIAGESHCFESLTFGRKLVQGRWEASLTVHGGGICSIDGRQVPFKRNLGLCATRQLQFHQRWSFGIGTCLWQNADYTIGNLAVHYDPLSIIDDGLQLTAKLLIRFKMSRGKIVGADAQ